MRLCQVILTLSIKHATVAALEALELDASFGFASGVVLLDLLTVSTMGMVLKIQELQDRFDWNPQRPMTVASGCGFCMRWAVHQACYHSCSSFYLGNPI